MRTTRPAYHWKASKPVEIHELPPLLRRVAQTGTDVFIHTPDAAYVIWKLSEGDLVQMKVYQGRAETLEIEWSKAHPFGMSSHQDGALQFAETLLDTEADE